jgi:RNA polymerase sigma factor (sigma-70 family)
MADTPLRSVLQHLRRLVAAHDAGQLLDAQLLQRFAQHGDEAAFETLMRRHGPMVLSVCRRVLPRLHDAEDVFQATFLVLARKAGSIRKHESVGCWLHSVAHRLALRARADAARRQLHEIRRAEQTPAVPSTDVDERELRAVLDEELTRLTAKYRAPLVLCYLEGKTQDEAAHELGWSVRTLKRRLGQGRELLRHRLTRRGVEVSAGLAGPLLGQPAAPALLPAALLTSTVRVATLLRSGETALAGGASAQAAALAEGLLNALFVTKLKLAAALVLVVSGLAAAGYGISTISLPAPERPTPLAETRAPAEEAQPAPVGRTDPYGDPLPPGALARLGTVRFRHRGGVLSIAFSPDGRFIAAGEQHGHVRLWDAATGRDARPLSDVREGPTVALDFSPDSQRLATGEGYGVWLWDVANGRKLYDCERSYRGLVTAVAFAPDGQTLAVAAKDDPTVWLYTAATGKVRRRLDGHGAPVRAVAFSRDGKTLASASDDQTARLWDTATGQERRVFSEPDGVAAVALSPEGRFLATQTRQSVRLWDLDTGRVVRRLGDEGSSRRNLAFSPDGRLLISGCTLWEVATGKNVCQVEGVRVGTCSAFAPDGKTVAVGSSDSVVSLHDVTTGQELSPVSAPGNRGHVYAVAFAPDSKTLATTRAGRMQLWEPATGKEIRCFPLPDSQAGVLAFSPDGNLLATEGPNGTVAVCEAATGRELHRLPGHPAAGPPQPNKRVLWALAFSPNGKTLASGGVDHAVRLWDVADGEQLRVLQGHQGTVKSVVFAADGRTLLSGSVDQTVRLWDVATGQELRRYDGRFEKGLGFSPDGRIVAAGVQEQRNLGLRLQELATGKLLGRFEQLTSSPPHVAFSPDGRTVAAAVLNLVSSQGAKETIHLWEVASGQERARLPGSQSLTLSLAFSADGRLLASGGMETTAVIWDLTGRLHEGRLRAAVLSPAEQQALWEELASPDAAKAYQALWTFAAAPKQAVPFLQQHLRPQPAGPRPLEPLGEEPEVSRSLEQLRELRAIELLEQIGSPDARRVLQALGTPEAEHSREALASLGRLEKRSSVTP